MVVSIAAEYRSLDCVLAGCRVGDPGVGKQGKYILTATPESQDFGFEKAKFHRPPDVSGRIILQLLVCLILGSSQVPVAQVRADILYGRLRIRRRRDIRPVTSTQTQEKSGDDYGGMGVPSVLAVAMLAMPFVLHPSSARISVS